MELNFRIIKEFNYWMTPLIKTKLFQILKMVANKEDYMKHNKNNNKWMLREKVEKMIGISRFSKERIILTNFQI